jgi:uncharacterized membrane protein YtjA (UPF0391 family)
MYAWAMTCFIVAAVAAVAAYSGIAREATTPVWICAAVAAVLAVIFAIAGRRPPE